MSCPSGPRTAFKKKKKTEKLIRSVSRTSFHLAWCTEHSGSAREHVPFLSRMPRSEIVSSCLNTLPLLARPCKTTSRTIALCYPLEPTSKCLLKFLLFTPVCVDNPGPMQFVFHETTSTNSCPFLKDQQQYSARKEKKKRKKRINSSNINVGPFVSSGISFLLNDFNL